MHVVDANSLYSSIASQMELPVGKYEIWTDLSMLQLIEYKKESHAHFYKGEEMIGIALVEMKSPFEGIPFIGIQCDNRYIYTLCAECAKSESKKNCRHGDIKRNILATLTWPEINFMVGFLGYKLISIFETYQWKQKANFFQKFLKVLEHFKLRAEKPQVGKSPEDFCQDMNKANQFENELELSPALLKPNASMRKTYKEVLCSILGKMAQINSKTNCKVIKSQSSLTSLFYSPESKIDDIFAVGKACLVITSPKKLRKPTVNKKSSMIVYAYITAQSRIFMHQKMMDLRRMSCRLIALSNDCLYFVASLNVTLPFEIGKHFGTFKHEYNPNHIKAYLSFGMKFTSLYLSGDNGTFETVIKARGFCLKTALIKEALNFPALLNSFYDTQCKSIVIPQIRKRKILPTTASYVKKQAFHLKTNIISPYLIDENWSTTAIGSRILSNSKK